MEDKEFWDKITAELKELQRATLTSFWINTMLDTEPVEEEPDWDYERLFDSEDDAGIYPED